MWKSSITPNHDLVDSGAHGLCQWAILVPRGGSAPDVRRALRRSPEAIGALGWRCASGAHMESRSREAAASSGNVRTTKPPESIGVPTSTAPERPLHFDQGWHGARAPGAPFGPRLFPMERRSRYGTRVYAHLCPFSSVDTFTSADRLRKGKKGLKTNEFRAFCRELIRPDRARARIQGAAGWGSEGKTGENERPRGGKWGRPRVPAWTFLVRSDGAGRLFSLQLGEA